MFLYLETYLESTRFLPPHHATGALHSAGTTTHTLCAVDVEEGAVLATSSASEGITYLKEQGRGETHVQRTRQGTTAQETSVPKALGTHITPAIEERRSTERIWNAPGTHTTPAVEERCSCDV